MDITDRPGPVRDGEKLPLEPLRAYLETVLGGAVGDLEIAQFRGGHSNLTYLIRCDGRELVLRRPPFGTEVKSAHDMGREHRVLSALAPRWSPAPAPIAACDDPAVIGAPFYLMERVSGLILRKQPPAGFTLDEATADRLSQILIDTLAELHQIDYAAIGLGELGRPEGYIDRQVSGWSDRYRRSQTDEVPAVEALAEWLAANKPAGTRAALIHNDFKYDNLVLDPETLEVRGVLDWEMSTVGDPWMDLGTALCYWVEAGDGPMLEQLAFGPTTAPGMWTRARLLDRYREVTGDVVERPLFFYVFGLFKLAVVVQQIYYRFVKGHTRDPRFAAFGQAVSLLAHQGERALERDRI